MQRCAAVRLRKRACRQQNLANGLRARCAQRAVQLALNAISPQFDEPPDDVAITLAGPSRGPQMVEGGRFDNWPYDVIGPAMRGASSGIVDQMAG
jgi:hypothetical protein